jgi:transposase
MIRLRGKDRRVVRCHKSEQRTMLRAKIVLRAARGVSNSDIALHLGVDVKTVRKWRSRFKYWGLYGLRDEERSGRPRVFDSKVQHELFSLVVQTPPEPYSRWSLDLLAKTLIDGRLVESISIDTLSS